MNPSAHALPSLPSLPSLSEVVTVPRCWASPVPLNELTDDCKQRATKLQAALRPFLEVQQDQAPTVAEFESRGVQAYFRVFRVPITDRYWRKLHKRTIDRDGGA